MTSVPLLPPDALCAPVPLLGAGGSVVDPLLGVALDGSMSDPDAVAAAARASDRILVGVGPVPPGRALLARALDLTLVPTGREDGPEQIPVGSPDEALAGLRATALANPGAATLLAGLLRWSGALSVPAALDAESLAYSTLLGGPEFRNWLTRRPPRPLPPTVSEPVRAVRNGDELRITLNRPERRNAYGRLLRDALVELLEVAVLDPAVQIRIDGAGPVFCAGGDLDEFGTTPDPVTAHLVRTRAGAARWIHALRDRTHVLLHGACVGAGIELPAFAGRVIAEPDTTLQLPEIGMGLIPGAGGTVSIPRRIGRWRTLYLALSGRSLDIDTARSWGLVDEIS